MNRKTWIVLAAACVLSAGTLAAESKPIFYLHTGTTFPAAPAFLKDAYTQGFNVGAIAGLRLKRSLEVQAAFQYNNCAFEYSGFRGTVPEIQAYRQNHDQADPDLSIEGNAANVWNVFANAKLIVPRKEESRMESYVVLGVGLFGLHKGAITVYDFTDGSELFGSDGKRVFPASTETVPAAQFALGLDVLLDEHTNLFIEIGPMAGFTKAKTTVIFPLKFGVSIRP
jgi:hypothetical protein